MKKKIIILTTFVICVIPQVISINSFDAEASTLKMSNKILNLPNLSNKNTIERLNKHKYSYYGITTNMSKKELFNKWGEPNKITKKIKYKKMEEELFYGNKNNVIITVRSHIDDKKSGKILSLKVKDNSFSIKLKDIYPLYQNNFKKVKFKNKVYLTNDLVTLTFEKKYKTYYATELSYNAGSTILE